MSKLAVSQNAVTYRRTMQSPEAMSKQDGHVLPSLLIESRRLLRQIVWMPRPSIWLLQQSLKTMTGMLLLSSISQPVDWMHTKTESRRHRELHHLPAAPSLQPHHQSGAAACAWRAACHPSLQLHACCEIALLYTGVEVVYRLYHSILCSFARQGPLAGDTLPFMQMMTANKLQRPLLFRRPGPMCAGSADTVVNVLLVERLDPCLEWM